MSTQKELDTLVRQFATFREFYNCYKSEYLVGTSHYSQLGALPYLTSICQYAVTSAKLIKSLVPFDLFKWGVDLCRSCHINDQNSSFDMSVVARIIAFELFTGWPAANSVTTEPDIGMKCCVEHLTEMRNRTTYCGTWEPLPYLVKIAEKARINPLIVLEQVPSELFMWGFKMCIESTTTCSQDMIDINMINDVIVDHLFVRW